MPRLVEYANTQNIAPTERGVEAFAQAGRRIGASYNQVAGSLRNFGEREGQNIASALRDAGDVANQYAVHSEIGRGIASYAVLQDQLITQWNDVAKNADPNDPSVRQRFLQDKLGPSLQQWSDSFNTEGGQQWAQSRSAAFLDHMYQKTAADQGSMAGEAMVQNIKKLDTTFSNTAYGDPSSTDFLLGEVDQSVDGIIKSSPTLTPEEAAKVKAHGETIKANIVKAAAQSRIHDAPDPDAAAEEYPKRYPNYITGAEAHTLASNAQSEKRARNYDIDTNLRRQKEIDQQQSSDAFNGYLIKLETNNPKIQNDPTAQAILKDPALTKSDRRSLIQLYGRELKPETDARISAGTLTGLMRELYAPNADPQEVRKHAIDARLADAGKPGSLTTADFDRFNKELEDRKTPEGLALGQDRDRFFKRYGPTLDPAAAIEGQQSPAGAQARYRAETDAMRLEKTLKSQGKDPHSLYDPNSPNFFGSAANLRKYTVNMADANRSISDATKGNGTIAPATGAPATFEQRFQGQPRVDSKQMYDQLAPGATFVGADGKLYRKPQEGQQVPVSK